MSVERSLEAWEEVQRHGQDLADRLAQGFTGLLQSHNIVAPPPFSWTPPSKAPFFDHLEFPSSYAKRWDHLPSLVAESSGFSGGVSAIFDIGNRIGQAGAEVGACVGGVVQQLFRHVPLPFWQEDGLGSAVGLDLESRRKGEVLEKCRDEMGVTRERFGERGLMEETMGGLDESSEDGGFAFDLKSSGQFGRPQGSINVTTTYDSRNRDIESLIVARGDLWRVEASRGGANSGPERTPLFLLQLGPILFVRDTTLLLPVHLSKQHLLWYGYDRKNGVHSLCPALWSKHRRWLLMSMICLNPLACSFLDLQFPNGQLTYVSGEGFTTSAFFPAFGGLLQAQGQYPGETKFSFSCKNRWGTHITPTVQWPDRSFSLGVSQALAWKRSGLMDRPTLQLSICPTFGGSNPGFRAEAVHSVQEQLNLICGYAFTPHPSAYASVSLGRSKWNGNVGTSGLVFRVETPLSAVGRPSFSVQLNSGVEF